MLGEWGTKGGNAITYRAYAHVLRSQTASRQFIFVAQCFALSRLPADSSIAALAFRFHLSVLPGCGETLEQTP